MWACYTEDVSTQSAKSATAMFEKEANDSIYLVLNFFNLNFVTILRSFHHHVRFVKYDPVYCWN